MWTRCILLVLITMNAYILCSSMPLNPQLTSVLCSLSRSFHRWTLRIHTIYYIRTGQHTAIIMYALIANAVQSILCN